MLNTVVDLWGRGKGTLKHGDVRGMLVWQGCPRSFADSLSGNIIQSFLSRMARPEVDIRGKMGAAET